MSENLEQYVYNDKVFMVGGSPITLKPTGKFPVVAEQQWKTLDDAQSFIDDINGNAIPGTILTVVADGENNGVYFVESVGEGDDENFKPGVLIKIAEADVVKYKSNAEDYWRTCKVGGVNEGAKPEDFKDKTMSEMFDEILYPTLPPDITQPSATLSYSGSKLIEVGEKLPDTTDFKSTWNRGSVSYINSNKDNYYAGEFESEVLMMTPDDDFNQPSKEGSYSVVYKVTFKPGSELWDNKRNVVDGKYMGGTVSSSTITIKSVYPIYINTKTIDSVDKQPIKDYLVSNGCSFEVEVPSESRDNKFEFHIPEHLKIKSIGQYNPVDNDYTGSVDYVEIGTAEHAEHKDITYKKYVRTLDVESMIGKAKYKITITK